MDPVIPRSAVYAEALLGDVPNPVHCGGLGSSIRTLAVRVDSLAGRCSSRDRATTIRICIRCDGGGTADPDTSKVFLVEIRDDPEVERSTTVKSFAAWSTLRPTFARRSVTTPEIGAGTFVVAL